MNSDTEVQAPPSTGPPDSRAANMEVSAINEKAISRIKTLETCFLKCQLSRAPFGSKNLESFIASQTTYPVVPSLARHYNLPASLVRPQNQSAGGVSLSSGLAPHVPELVVFKVPMALGLRLPGSAGGRTQVPRFGTAHFIHR